MAKNTSGVLAQLGFGVALGLAIVACAGIFAATYMKVKANQNSIVVKGYAEDKIVSESGVWSGSIKASDTTLSGAYRALEDVRQKLLQLFAQEGFAVEDVQLGHTYKHHVYKRTDDGQYETNEIDTYHIVQDMEFHSNDVHKLKGLPAALGVLNLEGYDVDIGRLRFYYPSDKLDHLKIKLLAEASRSALERAEQFALNSGCKVGKLLRARQGVFQVTAPNSSDISDYGTYDTSSIEKIVKSVVTMDYRIE